MATAMQEFISTLKQKLNIIDVVSSYVSLERRGGNYWACCPFHHEKTPSFAVNESEQYYHCFGCSESGDMIKFVREMENVEFIEAVRILADRAGLAMPETDFDNTQTVELKRKKDAILKIMNECAHFYLNNLRSDKAKPHNEYIAKRNISPKIARTFGLGASLNFDDLPRFLLKKGYSRQDMIDSGTVNDVDGRLTDAQGGRLIFPVIDAMGNVIAFGGRVLKKTDFGKYKNTKKTIVFDKSNMLYNLNLLKKLKKEQTIKEVIIVEGYMDTLSLYEAGFKNVVASMGTALTQGQARLLKRYTDNVLISYDGDGPGQDANMRGLEILKENGLNVRVVPLPDELDPDEVIKQRGAEAYQKCLDAAMPLIDYKLKTLERGYNLKKTEDKRKFVSEAIKIIRTAESAAEQEDLLKALRDKTGITYESLSRDLASGKDDAVAATEKQPPPVKKDTASMTVKASRFVIAAYLFGAPYATEDVGQIPFSHSAHEMIANYLRGQKALGEKPRPSDLFGFFDDSSADYDELCRILDYSDGDKFSDKVSEDYFNGCVLKLRLNQLDSQIDTLKERVKTETDLSVVRLILEEINRLILQKQKLKGGDRK